ncbi:MAG: hypothetical protein M3457_06415 [Chloroflexota bacterium]|nr:hypothetical protein [Chloroflexota bacterium]
MAGSKNTSTSTASNNRSEQDHSNSNVDLGAAATEASEQIQDQVSGLTHQVRQQATDQLVSQKERLVDTLDTVALLLHQAGEHADLQDKAMLTGYVNKASGQLGQWSETLRERDVAQLLDDTVQFARRQPMLFFSGALAAGFAGARFLRSSTQQPETTSTPATDGESGTTDVPPYDSDQAAFNAALAAGNTSSEASMTTQADQQPEAGDFVEDYTAASLEGDELIDSSLAGTSDSTSTGQR